MEQDGVNGLMVIGRRWGHGVNPVEQLVPEPVLGKCEQLVDGRDRVLEVRHAHNVWLLKDGEQLGIPHLRSPAAWTVTRFAPVEPNRLVANRGVHRCAPTSP